MKVARRRVPSATMPPTGDYEGVRPTASGRQGRDSGMSVQGRDQPVVAVWQFVYMRRKGDGRHKPPLISFGKLGRPGPRGRDAASFAPRRTVAASEPAVPGRVSEGALRQRIRSLRELCERARGALASGACDAAS